MAHPVELSKMNTAEPPPPCVIAGQPEEQAFATAKGFVTNIYGAMDSGSHEHIPFRADSVACFQKGAADRYQGPALLPRIKQMHKGEARDLSGLAVQIFPGNSMFCLLNGAMNTQASAVASQRAQQQIPHRTADMFLLVNQDGLYVRNAVFRELDEDCGPAGQGAAQGPEFAKADEMAKNFVGAFYPSLDNAATRGQLSALYKDVSCLTVGQDLFKGSQHIAHKTHYLPQLVASNARAIEGVDAMPSPAGGYFIYVHGILQLAGEERKSRFIDVFHILPEGASFWITNQIMKVHGGVNE